MKKVTPVTKETILRIKHTLGEESPVQGIQIYKAVLEHGVQDYHGFTKWLETQDSEGVVEWIP